MIQEHRVLTLGVFSKAFKIMKKAEEKYFGDDSYCNLWKNRQN